MNFLVISSSLNPHSRSSLMARAARNLLQEAGHAATLLDLTEWDLPMCDGGACYSHENTVAVSKIVNEAQGILLATPVYNFDVNASAKNLLELTGNGWENKVVGFMCAAGGQGSYMSVMAFANSLMLDYRCIIIPRFVYATGKSFDGNKINDSAISERIEELTAMLIRLTEALA